MEYLTPNRSSSPAMYDGVLTVDQINLLYEKLIDHDGVRGSYLDYASVDELLKSSYQVRKHLTEAQVNDLLESRDWRMSLGSDLDLSLRMSIAGYAVRSVPPSRDYVLHFGLVTPVYAFYLRDVARRATFAIRARCCDLSAIMDFVPQGERCGKATKPKKYVTFKLPALRDEESFDSEKDLRRESWRNSTRDVRLEKVSDKSFPKLIHTLTRGHLKHLRESLLVWLFGGKTASLHEWFILQLPAAYRLRMRSIIYDDENFQEFRALVASTLQVQPQGMYEDFQFMKIQCMSMCRFWSRGLNLVDELFCQDALNFFTSLANIIDTHTSYDERPVALTILNYMCLITTKTFKKMLCMFPELVKAMFSRFSGETMPQGVNEDISFVLNSPMQTQFSALFSMFMSSSLFAKSSDSFKVGVHLLRKEGAETFGSIKFLAAIFKFFSGMYENGAKFFVTGDVKDLLGSYPEVQVIEDCDTYRMMITGIDRVKLLDNEGEGLKTIAEYVDKVTHLVSDKYKGNAAIFASYSSLKSSLYDFMSANRVETRPGFTMIVQGPSGCGKTDLVTEITSHIAALNGTTSQAIAFDYHSDHKFQNAPVAPMVLIENDGFQTKEEALENGALYLIQNSCDTNPFRWQAASLPDKQKAAFVPTATFITCNPRMYEMTKSSEGADKCNRRVFVCNVVPEPWIAELAKEKNFPVERYMMKVGAKEIDPALRPRNHLPLEEVLPGSLDYVNSRWFGVNGNALASEKESADGPFVYKLSYLACKPGNILDFCPTEHFFVTKSRSRFIAKVMRMIHDRPLARTFSSKKVERCVYGLPMPCTCENHVDMAALQVQGGSSSKFNYDELEEEVVESEERLEDGSPAYHYRVLSSTPAGPGFIAALRDTYQSLMANGEQFQEKFSELSGKKKCQIIFGLGFAALTIGVITTVYRVSKMALDSQAALHGECKDIPAERSVVHPFVKTLLPHVMGGTVPVMSAVVVVSRTGGLKLHGVITAPGRMVLPAHFFKPKTMYPLVYKDLTDMVEDDTFYVDWGTSVAFKYSERRLYQEGNRDCVVYCYGDKAGQPLALDVAVYRQIESTFNGKEVMPTLSGDKILYNYPSKEGHCGIPLMQENAVVAIHIAGVVRDGIGIGIPVNPAFLKAADDAFTDRHVPWANYPTRILPEMKVVLDKLTPGIPPNSDLSWMIKKGVITDCQKHDVITLGHDPKAFQKTRMSGKATSIKPYFQHLLKEEYVAPFVGHAKEEAGYVNFTTKSLAIPYGYPVGSYLEQATHLYIYLVQPVETKVQPMTLHQAMVGDTANVYYGATDPTKSIGFTLKSMNLNAKDVFQQVSDTEYGVCKQLRSQVDYVLEQWALSSSPFYFVETCHKDEMLPLSSVLAGKGRKFSIPDKAFNVACKMLLRPIVAIMREQWKNTGNVGALNPASNDWLELFDRMHDWVSCADHVTFDLRHAEVFQYVAQAMRGIALKVGYNDRQAKQVEVCILSILRGMKFDDAILYMKQVCLISGVEYTLDGNIAVNWILTTACDIQQCHEAQIAMDVMHDTFKAHVGDDKIDSYSDALMRRGFDPQISARIAATEYGYILTGPDKTVASLELMPKSTAEICKRKFVESRAADGRRIVMAPLEEKSLWKTLCYMTGKGAYDSTVDGNRCTIERELVMHTTEVQEKYYSVCAEHGLPVMDRKLLRASYEKGDFVYWQNTFITALPQLLTEDVEQHRNDKPSEPLVFRNSSYLIKVPGVLPGPEARLKRWSTELNSNENLHLTPNAEVVVNEYCTNCDVISQEITNALPEDPNASVENFFARPRLIYSINVNAGFVGPYVVDPIGNFFALGPVTNVAAQLIGFNGTAKLGIQITGSPAVQGKIRVTAIPVKRADDYHNSVPSWSGNGNQSLLRYDQLPHVDLDLSQTTGAELLLPHISPKNYVGPITVLPPMWNIILQEFYTPVSVYGLTTPTLYLKLYLSFPEINFSLLTPQMMREPGRLESALEYARAAAQASNGPFANVLTLAASVGSSVARQFGWSRPQDVIESTILSRRTCEMSLTGGSDNGAYGLILHPGAAKNGALMPRRSTRETEIAHLAGLWALAYHDLPIGSFASVGPDVCSYQGDYYPSPLNMVCWTMTQYSGDMVGKLVVTSNPLTSFRLCVNVYPAAVNGIGRTMTTDGSVIAHIVQCSGSTEFEFPVPYGHLSPTTRVTALPSGYTYVGRSQVVVWFLDLPNGPASPVVQPRFDLFVKGSSNLSFAYPTVANIMDFAEVQMMRAPVNAESLSGTLVKNIREISKRMTQTGIFDTDETSGSPNVMQIPAMGISPIVAAGSGSPVEYIGNTVNSSGPTYMHHLGWSFGAWYSMFYHARVGGAVHSMTMRFYSNTDLSGEIPDVGIWVHNAIGLPGSNEGYDHTFLGAPRYGGLGAQLFRSGDVMEIKVPDMSDDNFQYAGNCRWNTTIPDPVHTISVKDVGDNSAEFVTSSLTLFTSMADDFDLGYLTARPHLRRI